MRKLNFALTILGSAWPLRYLAASWTLCGGGVTREAVRWPLEEKALLTMHVFCSMKDRLPLAGCNFR